MKLACLVLHKRDKKYYIFPEYLDPQLLFLNDCTHNYDALIIMVNQCIISLPSLDMISHIDFVYRNDWKFTCMNSKN